jgi:hypothetical protein
MRTRIFAGIAVGAIAAVSLLAPASAATAGNAALSVLHGIPDTPVDVYVNGELTLDDFQPGDLAGPLDLPAGDYEVEVWQEKLGKKTEKVTVKAKEDTKVDWSLGAA